MTVNSMRWQIECAGWKRERAEVVLTVFDVKRSDGGADG